MADVVRSPVFTAAEAEAQLRAEGKGVDKQPAAPEPGAFKPPDADTEPLTDKQKAIIAAIDKFTPRLKGLSETEADIVLPDKRVIHLAKPKAATQIQQYQILGQLLPDGNYPEELRNMVHMLMYVDSIDGAKQARPVNKVEVQGILNLIGDEYVQHVVNGWFQHFMMKGVTLPL